MLNNWQPMSRPFYIICTIEGKNIKVPAAVCNQTFGVPIPTKMSFDSTGIVPASLKAMSFLLISI
jgi:hypothetical protein